MAWMKSAWATEWLADAVAETWPSHDIIEHTHKFTCLCNPTVQAVDNASGTGFSWHIIHNSFDEILDEDQTEPYTGL